jgi:hypothetical protein
MSCNHFRPTQHSLFAIFIDLEDFCINDYLITVLSGYGFGAFIWIPVQTSFVNPDNIKECLLLHVQIMKNLRIFFNTEQGTIFY